MVVICALVKGTVELLSRCARVENRALKSGMGEGALFKKHSPASHYVAQMSWIPNNEQLSQVPGKLIFWQGLQQRLARTDS